MAYLAAVSRKCEEPLAVVIQSSSAAGKSSLMESVLSMMPGEDKVKYSAMTGQSLFYLGEKDLKHKILAIAEEEGAKHAAYALKLLQSEGEISIASTGKEGTSGKLVTHHYRVEGPVMIFLTTTAIEVDEELLNRCLILTVNETREQTRAIHDRQRKAQTWEGQLAREERTRLIQLHQNAQRLIEPVRVVNPYADRLTFLDSRTRMRRDHAKYLTLIRTIALLHQYQRPRLTREHQGRKIEYIEVIPRDIELANQLCHQVLGRSLDELPPQTRKLLGMLGALVDEGCKAQQLPRKDYRFTRREVRAYTGWSDFQVRVHMGKLVSLEYVLPHRGGRGTSFVYELLLDERPASDADTGAPVMMGLIDPLTLEEGSPGYDSRIEGLTQEFVPLKAGFEGSSSPLRAPIEGGSRSPSSGHGSGKAAKISEVAPENGTKGVSKEEAIVSYLSPAVVEGAER